MQYDNLVEHMLNQCVNQVNHRWTDHSFSVLQDDQAIEPLLVALWQKLPSCTDKAELALQLWWASVELVSTSIAWGKTSGHSLTHPKASHI